MKIELDLTDAQLETLKDSGVENLTAYFQLLIDREVDRLWHIWRSRPKDKLLRNVGRPKASPEDKKIAELADLLKGVYFKLQDFYGMDFPQHLAEQYQELEKAIEGRDLKKLQWFMEVQPWQT